MDRRTFLKTSASAALPVVGSGCLAPPMSTYRLNDLGIKHEPGKIIGYASIEYTGSDMQGHVPFDFALFDGDARITEWTQVGRSFDPNTERLYTYTWTPHNSNIQTTKELGTERQDNIRIRKDEPNRHSQVKTTGDIGTVFEKAQDSGLL